MHHKHHTTHAVVFLAGIAVLGILIGGIGGLMGKNRQFFAGSAGALRDARLERIQERREMRLKARRGELKQTHRSAQVEKTYPQNNLSLRDQNLGIQFGVQLNAGMLSYPKLNIVAPLAWPDRSNWDTQNWIGLESQMQFALLFGLVAYPHSGEPGLPGNLVVAGHSSPPTIRAVGNPYSDVLATLPEARVGDRIEVTKNGKIFVYEVIEAKIIPATHTSILRPVSDISQLIVFTCYPVGTTKERFMVKAELVSGAEV